MPVPPKPAPHQQKLTAALECLRLGQTGRAETLLRAVLTDRPSQAEALNLLGLLTARTGRVEEAERLFGRLIRVAPKNHAAHDNRGAALTRLRRYNEALACFGQAQTLSPGNAGIWNNRGIALSGLEQVEDALACFDKALAAQPHFAAANDSRGIALTRLRRFAEAIAAFDRAIGLERGNAEFLVNRGVTLGHMGRFQEALETYGRACAAAPESMRAHRGRATALEHLARYDEAIAAYDRALALVPRDVGALTGRANALYASGRHAEALEGYAAAIASDPDYADAHWDESLCRLAMGDYETGWEKYEWRWKAALAGARPDIPEPCWKGDFPIAGKTLLVVAEQGLGDSLQFCRYVPMLAALGARVVVEVPRPLARLLSGLTGDPVVITEGERRPAFDAWTPMLSLPLAFRTTLAAIPAEVPYLRADPDAAAAWRERLSVLPGRKVGVVWAGAPKPDDPLSNTMDGRRSVTLEHYAPFFSVPGVSLISLQKGPPAVQAAALSPGMVLHDWTGELNDFADTAALIAALDLVISVDTSVAHLAGALEKPAWVLNRYDQCWRWLHGRTSSPWYPTARLFQQKTPGGWSGVIQDVAAALRAGI